MSAIQISSKEVLFALSGLDNEKAYKPDETIGIPLFANKKPYYKYYLFSDNQYDFCQG